MTNTFSDAIDQRLRDLISTLSEGSVAVTRWVIAYEITDGDTRVVQSTASDNATLQDMAGLLRFVTLEVDRAIGMVIDHRQSNS